MLVERRGEPLAAVGIALDENEARAEAASLIEKNNVHRQSFGRGFDGRGACDDGDSEARSVLADDDTGASACARSGDGLVATVHVDLASIDARQVAVVHYRNRVVARHLDERTRQVRFPWRWAHTDPSRRGTSEGESPEWRDKCVRREHDVHPLCVTGSPYQGAQIRIGCLSLERFESKLDPFLRQPCRARNLRNDRRTCVVHALRGAQQPPHVVHPLVERSHHADPPQIMATPIASRRERSSSPASAPLPRDR